MSYYNKSAMEPENLMSIFLNLGENVVMPI